MDVRPDLNRSVANGDAKKKQKSPKTALRGFIRVYSENMYKHFFLI